VAVVDGGIVNQRIVEPFGGAREDVDRRPVVDVAHGRLESCWRCVLGCWSLYERGEGVSLHRAVGLPHGCSDGTAIIIDKGNLEVVRMRVLLEEGAENISKEAEEEDLEEDEFLGYRTEELPRMMRCVGHGFKLLLLLVVLSLLLVLLLVLLFRLVEQGVFGG